MDGLEHCTCEIPYSWIFDVVVLTCMFLLGTQDTNGGPNWANNSADAPIMIDPKLPNRFYKQPSWFILAHVSFFMVYSTKFQWWWDFIDITLCSSGFCSTELRHLEHNLAIPHWSFLFSHTWEQDCHVSSLHDIPFAILFIQRSIIGRLLLNRDLHDVPVSVKVPSKGQLELFVEKRSIMTVIFDMN